MKDIGSATRTDNPDRDVVDRIVQRMQWCADTARLFGWGTETYELVQRALVARGMSEEDATAKLRHRSGETSRVKQLEQRIERMKVLLDKHAPDWRDEEG